MFSEGIKSMKNNKVTFALLLCTAIIGGIFGGETLASRSHKHASKTPVKKMGIRSIPTPVLEQMARGQQPFDPAMPATASQVWVNTKTGIYHMPGSRWYGNTAQGKYLPEKAALAEGDRRSERG